MRLNLFILILLLMSASCKKLIEIDPPASTITSTTAFSDSLTATSSIYGLYANINAPSSLLNEGNQTIGFGLYADELALATTDDVFYGYYLGSIDFRDGALNRFWNYSYDVIYSANVAVEEIDRSKGLTPSLKNTLMGEAKFIRGLCYFYLGSTFGKAPLILTSAYKDNIAVAGSPVADVYTQVLKDLNEAIDLLPSDYLLAGGERVRATKFAAMALAARIHLYSKEWAPAMDLCSKIIDQTSLYNMLSTPDDVFTKNNQEAILQLYEDNTIAPYGVTGEGAKFIPSGPVPRYYFRPDFYASIDPQDLRKSVWSDSILYLGQVYHYPLKYKLGIGMGKPNGEITQYYTLLRLAEVFLIRAECRARTGDYSGASADINKIRTRAGLNTIDLNDEQSLLNSVMNERKVEFMAELGHRWYDLRRMGMADSVNSAIKSNWKSFRQVFPLPYYELDRNPSLTQNPGY